MLASFDNPIHYTPTLQHVTAGHRWFTFLCDRTGADPVPTFREEVKRHFNGTLKGPFNEADRKKAGMTPSFYEGLSGEAGVAKKAAGAPQEISYEKPEGGTT